MEQAGLVLQLPAWSTRTADNLCSKRGSGTCPEPPRVPASHGHAEHSECPSSPLFSWVVCRGPRQAPALWPWQAGGGLPGQHGAVHPAVCCGCCRDPAWLLVLLSACPVGNGESGTGCGGTAPWAHVLLGVSAGRAAVAWLRGLVCRLSPLCWFGGREQWVLHPLLADAQRGG